MGQPNTSSAINGQRQKTLHIPPLHPLFPSAWKHDINPLHEQIKAFMDDKLSTIISDERVLKAMQKGDAGLWVAGLFSSLSSYDRLTLFATYTIFLFLWDDAIDGSSSSSSSAPTDPQKYCSDSLSFMRHHLLLGNSAGMTGDDDDVVGGGLPESNLPPKTTTTAATTTTPESAKVLGLFAEVAAGLKQQLGLTREAGDAIKDLQQLYDQLEYYVLSCLVERRERERVIASDERWGGRKTLSSTLTSTPIPTPTSAPTPTLKEFWAWRLGTSSVGVMIWFERVLNGFERGGDNKLPEWVWESDEVKAMGEAVNRGFVIINERFSLKKELKDGAPLNLIPITMDEFGLDLNEATKKVVQQLEDCIGEFDENAAALEEKAETEKEGDGEMVRKLADAYRAIVTGTLHFSIHSPRYGVLKDRRKDGSFEVELYE